MSQLHDEIERLALEGHPPAQIAAWVNVSRDTVYYVLRKARLAGRLIPKFASGAKVGLDQVSNPKQPAPAPVPDNHIAVPVRLQSLLESEAERAGKAPADLARSILEKGLLERWSRHG